MIDQDHLCLYSRNIPLIKSLARVVLKEAFNVTSVEDFALYVPPKQEVIERYTTSSVPESGPNKDSLEVDMRGKISSLWNKRVIEILADSAEERRIHDEEYQWLPKRSSQYMGELFKSLLERARVAFNNAQQRFKDNGEIETLEEAEERMANQKEKSLKDVRVNTRRQAVRFQSFNPFSHAKINIRNTNGGLNLRIKSHEPRSPIHKRRRWRDSGSRLLRIWGRTA